MVWVWTTRPCVFFSLIPIEEKVDLAETVNFFKWLWVEPTIRLGDFAVLTIFDELHGMFWNFRRFEAYNIKDYDVQNISRQANLKAHKLLVVHFIDKPLKKHCIPVSMASWVNFIKQILQKKWKWKKIYHNVDLIEHTTLKYKVEDG